MTDGPRPPALGRGAAAPAPPARAPRTPLARAIDALLLTGVALGAVARVARYVDARSLWADEAALALNLWKRGALALAAPLDYGQAAPPGFLWLERALLVALGPGELVLRALPLAASLAAIPAFAALARRALAPRDARIALFLFATCEPLVFYASELKPYALDVLVGIALLALSLDALRARARGAPLPVARLAVAGAVAPWLSLPAVFALGALAIGLAIGSLRARAPRALPRLAGVGLAWAASFAALWAVQLGAARRDPYLVSFWAGAYPPFPVSSADDVAWYARTALGFFADPVGLPPAAVALAFAALGAARLARARPRAALVLVGPGLVALAASIGGLYPLRTWPPLALGAATGPFAGRLWLFAVPPALLLVASGVGALRAGGALARRSAPPDAADASRAARAVSAADALSEIAVALGLVAVCAASVVQLFRNVAHPPVVQELAPVARAIGERAERGDAAWVQRGSELVFEYYARRLALPVAARSAGARDADELAALEARAAALAPGARVWLVALDHPAWNAGAERAALERVLASRARERARIAAPNALAVLYEVAPVAGEAGGGVAGAPVSPPRTRASSASDTR
ncbi:MAG: hypothetical protein R3E88_16475 [Myxococcota bacterium]